MPKLFLRPEEFGGIVFDAPSERLYFVDEFGFNVFEAVANGASSEVLRSAAFRHFPVSDHETAARRIDSVVQFIMLDDRSEETIRNATGLSGKILPALSAPLDLYWEITRRCNEKCVHCYNNSSPSGFNPSFNHIERIAIELASSRLKNITLTGGEPMMRRDFWSIVELLRPITHELSLGTNGTLITENNVERVCESFDVLNISLDDPDPVKFDEFRGYSGAFDRTFRALKILSGRNIRINIQSVLTRDSIDRLDALGSLLENVQVDDWVVRFAFESGRATEGGQYLNGREIFERSDFLRGIGEKYQTKERQVTIGANYPWSYQEKYPFVSPTDDLQTCAAATTHAAVDAFGRMAPCSLFTETEYRTPSVYGRSFLDAWKSASQFVEMRTLRRKDVKGCGTCANAAGICGGGCRAKAYMRYGTIKKNDYSCNYSN